LFLVIAAWAEAIAPVSNEKFRTQAEEDVWHPERF